MIERNIMKLVRETLDENKIPLVMGLRRIGKTTMLEMLQKEYKDSVIITWDSFDLLIKSDLEFFNYIKQQVNMGAKVLLMDEVQSRPHWDIMIKNIYDQYVSKNQLKVVITGSSSMILSSKDLGVNRTRRMIIDTWEFNEYLELTSKQDTFEEFEMFLGRGFPEYATSNKSFDFMIHDTLKPILEDDIPAAFPGTDTLALMRFVNNLKDLTNGEVNESALSIKTGISIITVRKYLDMLEKAMLLKKVYKINSDMSFPKKKQYKIYLNPHIHIWLLKRNFSELENKYKGHIIESYWLHWATSREGYWKTFYYLKDSLTNKEIDFVSLNGDQFKSLHEFKYKDVIDNSELEMLWSVDAQNRVVWCKENKIENGIKYLSIKDLNKNQDL